ncbi:unnamed protein product [Arabidopsis arenosa]|uniref:Uncharacterized protein n=1 Tax=Arabidopsis arenosa TaxID=38785 RepID=A0A8S1ZLW1_ARAAE|nr:unnamed protein product [Arabidopsis arenosa]
MIETSTYTHEISLYDGPKLVSMVKSPVFNEIEDPDPHLVLSREAEYEKEVANYLDVVLEEAMLEMTEHVVLEVTEHGEAEQDICKTYGFDPQSSPMLPRYVLQ